MNAEDLRALQAPLKERYREEPGAAMITLHATGRIGEEGIACRVDTGKALVEAGLHPATGVSGTAAAARGFPRGWYHRSVWHGSCVSEVMSGSWFCVPDESQS